METKAPQYLKELLDDLIDSKKISSLRHVSKVSNISASQISLILSGKRVLTSEVAFKIASSVKLGRAQTKNLLSYVDSDKKIIVLKKAEYKRLKSHFQQVESDESLIVSQWQHPAILSLAATAGFRCQASYVAQRLGISESLAQQSIDRLIEHKLLIRVGTKYIPSSMQFTTTCEIPSSAIRNGHKERLNLAHKAIDSVAMDKRDYSNFCFAFDAQKMKQAKEEIKRFRRKFVLKFETDKFASEVYLLNLQFFPLSKS